MALSLSAHKDLFKEEGFKNPPVDLKATDACMPQFCENTLMTSKEIIEYCQKTKAAEVKGRCCMRNEKNYTSIIGLDYTNCKIEKLTSALNSLSDELLKNVSIFDIRENLFLECNDDAYSGFLNLQTLYFPKMCDCPGGKFSWSVTQNDSCNGQLELCKSNFTNTDCTAHSQCTENGPGNFLCTCKEDYHGYKCLQKGAFPNLVFTLLLCGTILFLSAFMWYTQSRLVKKD